MSRLIALSLFAVVACGSSKAPAPKPAPAPSNPEAQQLCVESFTRNRSCTDLYIPALIDTRAKLDLPKGIADEVKQDRDAVIAKAKSEWATDSTDENIARNCQQMTAHMTEEAKPLQDTVRGCLAKTDCASYVPCIEQVEEQLIARGPARH